MSERSHERIDISVGVILRNEGEVEPCLSRNISAGGVSVVTPKRWPIGTTCSLEMVLDARRLSTLARVANHSEHGLGLEFVEPDGEFLSAIVDLVARHVPVGSGSSLVAPPLNRVKVEWAEKPLGAVRQKPLRRHQATFIDLSLDGAGIATKKRPDIGDDVIVFLLDAFEELNAPAGTLWSESKVVRLTEHGFAVRFVSPGVNFRRAITAIRRASR